MRFGIFYEHQLPRPWEPDSEQRLIEEALEQIELADRLGIEYVWEVEHHFLEEYSHSSAPEVFLAAASQRTRDIRLGHGIVLTAPRYNHPARTAERIAMLDLVSRGRVEFGTGESGSAMELGGFGIPPQEKRPMWREGLEVAIRCMTESPFTGHEGQYVSMPPRNVVPKPVQKPHPPLWVACSRRETILMAAELGMGALTFAFIDPEEARQWVGDYQKVLMERCTPVGEAVNTDLACVTPMMCHPDEREAALRGLEGGNFFGFSLAHYYIFGEHVPGMTDVWKEFIEKRGATGYSPEIELALAQETLGARVAAAQAAATDPSQAIGGLRGAVGTPAQLREYLRRYEEAGVDQVIFVQQAGRNRHEHIMESLELFAREVLPEFKERDERLRREKAERLAPHVEAALARKARPVREMPAGYRVQALPKQAIEAKHGEEMLERLARDSASGKPRPRAQDLVGD